MRSEDDVTNRILLATALAIAGAVAVCTAGDDVPLIENPSPAESDTAFYDLEELWRQGGPDGELLLGRNDRLYVAPRRNAYEIEVYDADGIPARRFSRPFTSRVRTGKELDELRGGIQSNMREQFPDAEVKLLPTQRDVRDLLPGPDGELWVTHAYGFPEEQEDLAGVYDVFDAEGRRLRIAALRALTPAPNGDSASCPATWRCATP